MTDLMKPIALQMWTVRAEAQRDFAGTLEKIAALGYAGVEQVHSLGYGGRTAAQTRALMADLGLESAGAHLTLNEWEADTEGLIAFQQELGVRYVAVSWLEPEQRADEAAYRKSGDSIRRIAARCEESGLKLLYHHHDYEFIRFHGQTALDMLSDIIGPERLGIEADVHWVKRGGDDPVEFLRRTGTRCPLVHFKDVTPFALQTPDHDDSRCFTPIGTGILDFPQIAAAAEHARWYIVEQDYCTEDPFETARISLKNLQKLGLAAG